MQSDVCDTSAAGQAVTPFDSWFAAVALVGLLAWFVVCWCWVLAVHFQNRKAPEFVWLWHVSITLVRARKLFTLLAVLHLVFVLSLWLLLPICGVPRSWPL